MSNPEPPGSFGIDRALKALQRRIDTLFANLGDQLADGFNRLERIEETMGSQLDEMNTKLDNIANTETQLGQDIQTVVDFLKANPNPTPTDLTAQLAKLDEIAQKLVDTDAKTLANLPPTPPPPPARRRS